MKRIFSYLILILIISSCEQQEEYLPTEFNYPIPDVEITQDVVVGAYYYNYAQADWDKNYTGTPELDEYSALDPAIMDQHRNWADEAGIDFFIFQWNGAADNALADNFIAQRNENVKMVLNYSTAHLKASNSSPLEGAKLTTMIDELKTLAAAHFANDYYLKVDGSPVIMITPINLSSSAASSIDYSTVIPTVRTELENSGVDAYIIGEINGGWLPPQRYSAANRKFDAIVLRDWKTEGNYGYDRAAFFAPFSDQAFKNWSDSTASWGNEFIPCIMPGFDDKTMSPSSKVYNVLRSVELYDDMCNVAIRNMGESRIVMINSWNNFQVGTTVEPTDEYGDDYLQITRDKFKLN